MKKKFIALCLLLSLVQVIGCNSSEIEVLKEENPQSITLEEPITETKKFEDIDGDIIGIEKDRFYLVHNENRKIYRLEDDGEGKNEEIAIINYNSSFCKIICRKEDETEIYLGKIGSKGIERIKKIYAGEESKIDFELWASRNKVYLKAEKDEKSKLENLYSN